MSLRQLRGKQAEISALSWLENKGLSLIMQNYHCRYGELDLIMRDDECIVIVEVRSRQSSQFLHPALSIDTHKQRKIIRTTEYFLQSHPAYTNNTVRFDVIAITGDQPDPINWIRDAFRVD